MLIIKVQNGKLEPALKQYKRKLRNTKLVKRLRDGQAFVKPSEKKRLNLQKAKYKESKRLSNEE
jgi:small subunit ribosomal protein S21